MNILCDYGHSEEVLGVSKDIHEKERISHFKHYGYDTLIIWEYELNDINKLKQKIKNFHKREIT